MKKKLIDFDWFKHEFNPNPASHHECLECDLSECLDDPDAVDNCSIWASLEDALDIAGRLAEYAEEKYLTPGNPLFMHVGIKQQLLEIAGKKESKNDIDTP